MARSSFLAATLAIATLASNTGFADDRFPEPEFGTPPPSVKEVAPTLRWDDKWRGVDTTDYVLTLGSVAVAFGSFAIPVGEGRWDPRNGLDDGVRDALRVGSIPQQDTADDASDLLLAASLNQLMVDALIIAWWKHDADEIAWRMGVINAETLAIVGAISNLTKALAARERPYGLDCETETGDPTFCDERERYQSFLSGHSSVSFAAAGLNCMHHMHLELYGHPVADTLSCVLGFGTAGATGMLRIVADRHWTTDVLTGAAVGTLGGFLIPYALHYGTDLEAKKKRPQVSVNLAPAPNGAALIGVF